LNTLDLRDRDLVSVQEARNLVALAGAAQKQFSAFSQHEVDAIVRACADAAADAAESLARRAVEETGFGNVADKTTKNLLAAVDLPRALEGMRTVGILREDRDKGILEVATPVGIVAAVIPSTNPTSTAIYKTLIALKSRNAIVLSPHPSAIRAICETASVLARAASSAGAPDGLIQCMQHTTLAATQELMRHPQIGVILATGGTGLVRAAYSSGKPAYGVGPGNVPAFIERSADVRKAVADILAGKTFDYGTICSSEQAIVCDESVLAVALEECTRQGAYFLSPEEAQRVGALVFLPGTHVPNTKIVGRPATAIAEMAGVSVPAATRALIARLETDRVGREFPLSAEKLSPILAFYTAANLAAGIDLCRRLLAFGGLGHTCAIHSQSDAAIREFGQAVPAFRVCVNTSAVHGSIGYSTNLFPAMTLGCGAPGGNITSDNIGPLHLVNVKRIAWESRPVEHRTVPASERMSGSVRGSEAAEPPRAAAATASAGTARSGVASGIESSATTRVPSATPIATPSTAPAAFAQSAESAAPAHEETAEGTQVGKLVERAMAERGIARAAGSLSAAEPPASDIAPVDEAAPSSHAVPLASPGQIAAEIAARVFGASTGAAAAAGVLNEAPAQVPAERRSIPVSSSTPSRTSAPAPVNVVPFVSENDVRRAMTRSEKIFIGPKTILTPSARDLGSEHDVFVQTEKSGA
jgi:acetaldehyde dehydrogenase (acetylating)